MLDVGEAREIVLRHAKRLPSEVAAVSSAALGRVVAEDVRADIDSPPFAKALMDGYAVRAADVATPGAELRVIEEVPAGAVPTKAVGPGEAVRLFTGAPMPAGADAVVAAGEDHRVRRPRPDQRPRGEAGPARPAPRQGDGGRRRRRAGRDGAHPGGVRAARGRRPDDASPLSRPRG